MAPFYQVIVENKKLAANTNMSHRESELAGNMQLTIRAFADKDLDEVIAAVNEAFAKFEKEGLSEKDLDRIKAGQERQFYNALSSVLGKGAVLAQYNIFAGDPGFVDKDINNILAVTPADVKRVYEK
jgi:zinc protease